jgi:hypothetical protein
MPALDAYLNVIEGLQRIFKALSVEADGIYADEVAIAKEKRANILYNKIKAKAKRIAGVSMSVLTFYEVANSRLKAMQSKTSSTVNWVDMWDQMYKENKSTGLLGKIKLVKVPKEKIKSLELPTVEELETRK